MRLGRFSPEAISPPLPGTPDDAPPPGEYTRFCFLLFCALPLRREGRPLASSIPAGFCIRCGCRSSLRSRGPRYGRWRSPEGAGTTRDRRGMSGVTSDQPVWAVDMGIGTFFTRDWTARDERDPPARALRSSCGVEVTRPTVIGRWRSPEGANITPERRGVSGVSSD